MTANTVSTPSERRQKDVILVTGGGGRIGLGILHRMARDYTIVAFDRDGQPQPPHEVECVLVDLTRPESVDLGMRRLRYAYGDRLASVVHLAAYHDFTGEPSPLYDEVTVKGTSRLLEGLEDFHVEQFIFSSTMLVHRATEPGVKIDEDSPLEAKWEYPRSKIDTEKVIRERRGEVPAVSLRISGVYSDDCESIPLASQIERIVSKPVQGRVFPGDPSHGQAYTHMDDAVESIRLCIEKRHELPNDFVPILIGEPRTYSYQELQHELGRCLLGDPEWPAHRIPEGLAKSVAWLQDRLPFTEPIVKPWMIDRADDHYELDVSRAERLLGWKPKHDLLETIPRMVESLARDPERWLRLNGIELSDSDVERVSEHQGS